MADQTPSNLLRIDINDFPKEQRHSSSEHRAVWHPLEHMNGHIIIKSPSALDIEKVGVHLEGFSRVWIEVLTEDDQTSILTSSHKFLHQSYDITAVERLQSFGSEDFTYIASFRLVIPRWAILKTDGVPDQCLGLPPSLSVGATYRRPGEDCEYAQPNIQYCFRAQVKLISDQDPIPLTSLQALKRIVILPYSPPMPPTETNDFPAEFIISASNTYRISLLGSWYSMTLSMEEPSAVCLRSTKTPGFVHATINVKIKASSSVVDATSLKKLPLSFKNLLFKTQPILRAKTFYSTEPFRKLPGQTMLSLKGSMRLNDEVMKLEGQELKPRSWQHDLSEEVYSSADVRRVSLKSARSESVSTVGSATTSEASSTLNDSPKVWSTRLFMQITVPPNLPPTFCSVTASRQYSLIMRIRVGGARIKEFVLEVPLQILYEPEGGQEQSSIFSTRELQPPFTSTSQLDEILNEMDHPDEDLPEYS